MTLVDEIQQFVRHFRQEALFVSTLAGDKSIDVSSNNPDVTVAMQKKILYSAMLDSLARIRYHGQSLSNHDRFTAIVRDHASWPDSLLVSVPVLHQRLSGVASPRLESFLSSRTARFSTSRGNALPLLAFDAELAVVEAQAEGAEELKAARASQHIELLYMYRNFVVHEFREPGYAIETFADGGADPVYHSFLSAKATWRLLYPAGFFHRLVASVVDSLEKWFVASSVDPYSRVKSSSSWYA